MPLSIPIRRNRKVQPKFVAAWAIVTIAELAILALFFLR